MTAEQFRRLALEFPDAIESEHMGHPDFRANGKIFASLGYPGEGFGMVKLTPAQQAAMMKEAPDTLSPSTGAWGRAGATSVRLTAARTEIVRSALAVARENVVAKQEQQQKKKRSRPGRSES